MNPDLQSALAVMRRCVPDQKNVTSKMRIGFGIRRTVQVSTSSNNVKMEFRLKVDGLNLGGFLILSESQVLSAEVLASTYKQSVK